MKPLISADTLRQLLSYDPETGKFTRAVQTSNRIKVGAAAGSPNGSGYLNIMLQARLYAAHRLAWLYVHGRWPNGQIDHINGDKTDNRIANLREANNSENTQNKWRARNDSRSGTMGVRWHERDQRWHARIMIEGRAHHLGSFMTEEAARDAYLAAKRKLHAFGEIAKRTA